MSRAQLISFARQANCATRARSTAGSLRFR